MKKAVLFLYTLWGALVFVTALLITFPFILIFSFFPPKGTVIAYWFLRGLTIAFSIFAFIPIKVINRPSKKEATGYIYISNHTSFLDAISIVRSIPGAIKPLGKVELLKMPIVGILISRFAVVVDRASKESRAKSMESLREAIHGVSSLMIFPEGTMNRTTEKLQKFYEGAFRISKESGVPLKPIILVNGGNLLPPGKFKLKPGRITVEFGPEIEPTLEISEMVERARTWMLAKLEEHS